MGRIKTRDIKKLAAKLIKENDKFVGNFKGNKEVLKGIYINKTKKMQNKIAGYIAKTLKREGR